MAPAQEPMKDNGGNSRIIHSSAGDRSVSTDFTKREGRTGIASHAIGTTIFWSLLVSIPVSHAGGDLIVQQLSGKLPQHPEPFTINDDWELRWDDKGVLAMTCFRLSSNQPPWTNLLMWLPR
ncbi:MAG: hypothetical protein ABI980_08705 [Nitrospirota bacterium]